jgi:hypothetical protein
MDWEPLASKMVLTIDMFCCFTGSTRFFGMIQTRHILFFLPFVCFMHFSPNTVAYTK